jgi:hypothetical protein
MAEGKKKELDEAKDLKEVELAKQGRAIARGISQENAQKERNMAKATKRKDTMLRNEAERMLRGN